MNLYTEKVFMRRHLSLLVAATVVAVMLGFAMLGGSSVAQTSGTVRRVASGDCVAVAGTIEPSFAGSLRVRSGGSGSVQVRCSIRNHLGDASYSELKAYVTRHSAAPTSSDGYCRARIVEDFGATTNLANVGYGPNTVYDVTGPSEEPLVAPTGTHAVGWWTVHCSFPKPATTGQTSYTLWGFEVTE